MTRFAYCAELNLAATWGDDGTLTIWAESPVPTVMMPTEFLAGPWAKYLRAPATSAPVRPLRVLRHGESPATVEATGADGAGP